jgi:hypothetical protein
VDGGQHAERVVQDQRRTAFLEREGLTVLRFWNNDVLRNTGGVLQLILNTLEQLPPKFTRPPLPLAGGEAPRKGSHESNTFVGSRRGDGVGQNLVDRAHPQPPPARGRGLT